MGIHNEPKNVVAGLVVAGSLPKSFTVCELGDQWCTEVTPHELARDWYKRLGCGRYESIDGNGRGTLCFDLNRRLPDIGVFDLVTDFGTGEHIFDQAQVWRTMHQLAKAGGYIVFDRPCQGYDGHCFYNTQESLFWDIAAANGYEVAGMARRRTTRGEMVTGAFRKGVAAKFKAPQQGRYAKILQIGK